MSQDERRNDATLRHFQSRSQQPKLLAGGPIAVTGIPTAPVNVFVVYDQGFGSVTDQIDDTRFKYMGTNPQVSRFEKMSGRRLNQATMRESFNWS